MYKSMTYSNINHTLSKKRQLISNGKVQHRCRTSTAKGKPSGWSPWENYPQRTRI